MKRPEKVKRLHCFIDEAIHLQMRLQAVREGKSLREFVEHISQHYFESIEIKEFERDRLYLGLTGQLSKEAEQE